MTLRFLLIKDFPQAGENQQAAEELFQSRNIDQGTEVRKNRRGNTAGNDGWYDFAKGDLSLSAAKTGADNRRGQEKQQIDTSCGAMRHVQNHCQP